MDQETQAKVQLWKDNVEEPDLKSELDELLSGDEENSTTPSTATSRSARPGCVACWASAPTA